MNKAGRSSCRVAVIVPVHNRRSHTLECLSSLQRVAYPDFSVVVVDDGSSDGTAAAVAEQFPGVTLLKGDGNLWWSGAVNLGIRHGLEEGFHALCLVNNDNTFAPDFLSRLVECLQRSGADAVCSRVIHRDSGRLFFGGGILHPWHGLRMYRRDGAQEEADVDWCGGMGVLFRADVFRGMGMFDARMFPQYYGDADFCLRLRRKGRRLRYCPDALVFNDPTSTGVHHRTGRLADLAATLVSRRSHLNLVSTWRFYRRHRPLLLPLMIPRRLVRVMGGFLVHRLLRRRRTGCQVVAPGGKVENGRDGSRRRR